LIVIVRTFQGQHPRMAFFFEMTKIEDIEIWKDVLGFENYYQVSDLGRVKSKDRWSDYLSYQRKGKTLNLVQNRKGYLRVKFHIDCKEIQKTVHRLVAIAFIPNPENKPEVNHLDGNKLNNAKWNLAWATEKENTNHAIEIGLRPRNAPSTAKLTESNVLEIRKMIANGNKLRDIAKLFPVVECTISAIKHRRLWSELQNGK
jgi:hypothetical protein